MTEEILFSQEQIAEQATRLGKEITDFYAEKPLTAIIIMNGAVFFAADLLRKVDNRDLLVDSMAVIGYKNDMAAEKLCFRSQLKLSVKDRHILLIDDIYDSGRTITQVRQYLLEQGALSVRTCVLLKKELPADKQIGTCDWFGMTVRDEFVYGYGMDTNERFRNLPYIAYLKK